MRPSEHELVNDYNRNRDAAEEGAQDFTLAAERAQIQASLAIAAALGIIGIKLGEIERMMRNRK